MRLPGEPGDALFWDRWRGGQFLPFDSDGNAKTGGAVAKSGKAGNPIASVTGEWDGKALKVATIRLE